MLEILHKNNKHYIPNNQHPLTAHNNNKTAAAQDAPEGYTEITASSPKNIKALIGVNYRNGADLTAFLNQILKSGKQNELAEFTHISVYSDGSLGIEIELRDEELHKAL